MKKSVAYYRSSTDIQEDSVSIQRSMVMKASIQKAILIDKEYTDEFYSARKMKTHERPAMKKLLEEIKAGNIANLFVYKRDRIARQVEDYMQFYHLCREHDVNVIFASENELPMQFNGLGEFFELLMAAINQREAEKINESILASKISKFLAGDYIGPLPYGYRHNKQKNEIEKVENELEKVQLIFKRSS